MIRTRFTKNDDGSWTQVVLDVSACDINVHHIECITGEEVQEHVKQMATTLNIASGSMHCAALFELGTEQRIYFTIHHLVADLVSWQILLGDLERLLQGDRLEEKTTSFQEWANSQVHQASLFCPAKWTQNIQHIDMSDLSESSSTEPISSDNQVLVSKLCASMSSLLDTANEPYRTSNQDLILAALLMSFHATTRKTNLSLSLEGHGREPWDNQLDVSRTVGWFTTIYPVTLSVTPSYSIGQVIMGVKNSLRMVPDKGLSYGAIKYLAFSTDSLKEIKSHKLAPISFNYLGRFHNFQKADAFFIPDNRIDASNHDENEIFEEIAINCSFNADGYLELNVRFNSSLFQSGVLEEWGKKWVESMEVIVNHCTNPETPGSISSYDLTLLTDPILISEIEEEHLLLLGVKPRNIEDIYPATPLQASFISALALDPQAYMVQSVYEVEGIFDEHRFKYAWKKVAAANPILRTAFISTQRGVYQVVLRNPPNVLEESFEWAEDAVSMQQKAMLIADRNRGFHLKHVVYARFTIAKIKDTNRSRLLWTVHHSIIDGWSKLLLFNDLMKAYSGDKLEIRPPFKAHIESILSTNIDEAKVYWTSVFEGATVPEKLSISDEITPNGGSISQTYKLDITIDRLHGYCNELGVTISNFLRAIWAIVLRHYTRCDDIIFGCVVMGRNERVDNVTSHIPLGDIKRWTGLPWMQEMFPTILSYQDTSSQYDDTGNMSNEFRITEIENHESTEYAISISIHQTNSHLNLTALIDTSIIGLGAVNRMVSKFEDVLMRVLNGSCQYPPTLLELDALTSTDQFILNDISHGEQAELAYRCLHHGFELNASWNPDSIAVMAYSGDSITYGELDQYANALAHELRRLGVIPGCNVGLVIKRSIEMIIGILAILKAGGAYVPIDATFPRDRIEYILNDADCSVVVTMRDAINSIPDAESNVIILIEKFMYSGTASITKPADISTSEDTAYIVYTSGTTGEPKGVPIHHGGAMNCIQDLLHKNGSGPGVLQSQFMSVGFDGAIGEIFTCFTHGGTLILRSEDDVIASLNNVQTLFITPTGLQHIKPEDVPNLRVITVGAEPVPQTLVDTWLPHVKQAITQIVTHHDMLRTRFTNQGINSWKQTVMDVGVGEVNVHHIECKDRKEVQEHVKHMASTLDIAKGPMHCAALIELGTEQRVYFTIHHLVVDLVSWRIILEDLESLLQGYHLGEKTTSFQEWAVAQVQQAIHFDPIKWAQNISPSDTTELFENDCIEAICSGNQVLVNRLSSSASILFDAANEAYRTNNQDLVLAALLLSFHAITEKTTLSLNLEGHGREPWDDCLDISRTVGWFTTIYPVNLSMTSSDSIGSVIMGVKNNLRTVPNKGLSYGVIKYLAPTTDTTDKIKKHKLAPINFNYLGRFHNFEKAEAFFAPDESIKACYHDENEAFREINISCSFGADRCLELTIYFNSSLFKASTLEAWGKRWTETMEALIKHCCNPATPGGISSFDFTLLEDPTLISEIEEEHLPVMGVKPRDVEDIYPATPLQASFISALAQNPQAYVVQSVYEINGPLDANRLELAWYKVAVANPILRTAFVSTQRGVYQVVLRLPPNVFEETLEWSEDLVSQFQGHLLVVDRCRGFRLDCVAFARFTLIHIKNTTRYRLFWTMHHSIIDGWCISLIFSDIMEAYAGIKLKIRPPFKTHVESILSTNINEAMMFWKSVFEGAIVPDKLDISKGGSKHKFERPILQTYKFDITMDCLHRYCNGLGITISNFLRAIWAIVLRHYTRCDDVIFGCVILGRDEGVDNVTSMIGALINTIPIRAILKDSMTIHDLLQAMQEYHIASLPYSHVSLSNIKRWTGLPWMQEMFPTILSYQNTYSQQNAIGNELNGFQTTEVEHYEGTEYPLTITIQAFNSTLALDALVNMSMIDTRDVDRIISKLEDVLLTVLNSTSKYPPTLLELDVLSPTDITDLACISQGKKAQLSYQCLHHGFEFNATKQPDAVAVEGYFGKTITYYELDLRANAIAHSLRIQGVAQGCKVGLIIKRSIEMVVGILAILKAGGAYVPIDATLPRDRMEYMLKDAACSVVLAMQATICILPQPVSQRVILIDDFMHMVPEHITKPLDLSSSDDTAYIVYTSGTTGQPKGVPIHHGGAMNCIQDLLTINGSGPGILQSQFMSVGFDGAVADIFTCLTHGGTLVLRSEDDVVESLKRVEALTITPTGLQHIQPEDVPNLHVITVCGEPVPQSLVDKWSQHVKLLNAYGPTETSIISSVQELRRGKRIGIGRPINNMSYYVLDQKLRMAPLGVTGELYIAGPGIAKEYLNRPELTTERFIENPFIPGTTMYKTGDIVRWNLDGNLEILVRSDDQVKLKGYRVELGEVAAAMNTYPGVEVAVALVNESMLIGFVTPVGVDVDRLRDSLFDTLPDYMVPATIVALEAFPMTTNGKVDKDKLREIPAQSAVDRQLPATDKQQLVVDLMATVLNVDRNMIDLQTSFFALGGDSISATALISAFHKHGLDISLKQLYKSPTPATLLLDSNITKPPNDTKFFNEHGPHISRRIRILCLHGSDMSGKIMKFKMALLEKELYSLVDFIYLDACFDSDMAYVQELEKYYDSSFFTWFPPYQSNREHVEQSIYHVLTFLSSLGKKVDGLLGYCQGSCIIELLDRMAESGEIERQWGFSVHISGVLLDQILDDNILPAGLSPANLCAPISTPSVHCMSPIDGLYEDNLKVQGRYNPELRLTLEHNFGHNIPQAAEAVSTLGRFILDTAEICQKS
ncbi:uncharacterized protein VTP21DRAFT_4724 [Calcarisporiella thermophila]|uniref:uncharacterized protein n=1 Tax=Calcarisporiella thermophila TaxID=911321 RepID=UPI003743427C